MWSATPKRSLESLIFCIHLLPVATKQKGSKIVDGVHVCMPVSAQNPRAMGCAQGM